ncbi:helix-turn-helix transcriptional regulator [Brevibacillus sp. FSL K6-2834]|jgi:transcriptional regulator with XRE-family HTH domain|uniref:helix-turn-helix domain-containing protein n=1 Tax=Brevibacillus sp. FSL K6-2834 TaxID=2954680 RepID=UPI0031587C86
MPNPQILEKYRLKRKMSVKQLTEKMGKTPGWYSKIKRGHFHLPSYHIPKMAEVLGVKPEVLAKEYFSEVKLEKTSSFDEDEPQTA